MNSLEEENRQLNNELDDDEDLCMIVQKMMKRPEQKEIKKQISKGKYHILNEDNKLRFSKDCSACNQLFSSDLMINLYGDCEEDIKDISELRDFNLEKIDLQCLAIQVIKAEDILNKKLSHICYDLQIKQFSLQKALSKYNISFPFKVNNESKEDFFGYTSQNQYKKQKYDNEVFLRSVLFQSIEYIHNIIQNIDLNKQHYYKYNYIKNDQTLTNDTKLNELIKLRKKVQKEKNLDYDDQRNDFPVLEIGILFYQHLVNRNRSKIIEQTQNVIMNYPSISAYSFLLYFMVYNSGGVFEIDQYLGDTVESVINKSKRINSHYESIRSLEIKYLYNTGQFNDVIRSAKSIINEEDPLNISLHQILFQVYIQQNNVNSAIEHLHYMYLDNRSEVIDLFNNIYKYTTNKRIILNIQIQQSIIQFILFHLAYNKLDLPSFLYMPSSQHWDLFY